jgi:CubicO group peptidase (beta-lactamase class C family)
LLELDKNTATILGSLKWCVPLDRGLAMRLHPVRRAGSIAGAFLLVASICGAAVAQERPEPLWPTAGWQTSTPEEQGMDSAVLARLVDYGTTLSFDSLLIVRHGKIVLDASYAPYSSDVPHIINSSTKAVIGTLTALAIKDGLLDNADHRMLDLFADRSITNLDDRKKAITLQHLLDMTSGIDWKEPLDGRPESVIDMERSPDWIKFILDRPMARAPGDIFNYDSGNPHLLSAILSKVTGMSAEDYAKARLFGPLGITTWNWRRDPQGISTGGYGLALQPRDMAKIGYLYLHHGEWEDKPLVPRDWVERASHATVNMNVTFEPAFRYSNLFWALPNKHVYFAAGYNCQLIMVFPELDIVAATTARDNCPHGRLADAISRAVKSETALAPDPAGASLLAVANRNSSTEKRSEVGAMPELASAISGKIYTFPANALNLKSLSLTFAEPEAHYDLELHRQDPGQPPLASSGQIGLDGLYRKGEPTAYGTAAIKGTWLNGSTFVIERLIIGAGQEAQKWTLSFDGGRLHLRGRSRDGRTLTIDGETGG